MHTLPRRDFLKKSGAALGSTALLGSVPFTMSGCSPAPQSRDLSFGFQVWTIRHQLFEDFAGVMKMMANYGYHEVEMCSPVGYANAGFAPLNAMSGTEMRTIIEDAGLRCTSTHLRLGELRTHLDERLEWCNQLGMKHIALDSFWLGDEATLDDYRRSCEELNQIGEKTMAAGQPIAFHNHHMEFEQLEGQLIYDVLLEELDPSIVTMQFQVAVVNVGYKAADYFRKYPGRFISAHLADWSEEKKSAVPIGQGIVDWQDFFTAAEIGGLKTYHVEMAPETFAESAQYLNNLS